jgi:hypothetical protein
VKPAAPRPAPAGSLAAAPQKTREKKAQHSAAAADFAVALGQQLARVAAKTVTPGRATASTRTPAAKLPPSATAMLAVMRSAMPSTMRSAMPAAMPAAMPSAMPLLRRAARGAETTASPAAGTRGRNVRPTGQQRPTAQLPPRESLQPADQGATSPHTVALSNPAVEPTAAPVLLQDVAAFMPAAAPLSVQAVQDASLQLALMTHAAHIEMDTGPSGELSLHLRVRDGVAEISAAGSAAPLLEARAPELSVSLAGEGLALGRFDLARQGEHQARPEPPPTAPDSARPTPPPASTSTEPGDERRETGRLHITA